MDEEDAEKIAFTTPWGTYCYRVMPFGRKTPGATYMRAMTAIFHDMMHQEIEVYVDDVIIKSRTQEDHVRDLRKFFERLHMYDLKLNPTKCVFGVPSGKLLGFIVSRRADALATLASMLPYLGNVPIDPLKIQIRERHGYCNAIEMELDAQPWYHDIKKFLKTKEYPEQANGVQKRTIRRLASSFFLSGEVLYKRTSDLNLLRCVDTREAETIMNEVHSGVCRPHMNGYVLAKKIFRTGY
ncbi:uncharacterized protein [Nicotiana tomentosiformis]|uniref:uncharacterized protein n=1 Tax=Nicotiana tomentosiformis TaxID=4098 RepID=UPI00388CA38F